MAYTILPASPNGKPSVLDTETGTTFPYRGRLYEQMLDAIIAEGAACFDGDIPTELQAAADAKLASEAYNADRV